MNLYESCHILSVTPSDDIQAIRKAYLLAVKKWHPDRFSHSGALKATAEDNIRLINTAYETLKHHLNKKSHTPFRQQKAPYTYPKTDPIKETPFDPTMKEVLIASLIHLLFRPLAFLLEGIQDPSNSRCQKNYGNTPKITRQSRHKRKSFSTILLEVQKRGGLKKHLKRKFYLRKSPYEAYIRRKKGDGKTCIEGVSESSRADPLKRVNKIRGIPPL